MIIPESFNYYRTGEVFIDDAHEGIFTELNKMYDVTTAQEAVVLLDKVAELWRAHTILEEEHMASIDYKYIDAHKARHRQLLFEFVELKEHVIRTRLIYGVRHYAQKFEDLVRDHIEYSDIPVFKKDTTNAT